jgi:hypothetical protein
MNPVALFFASGDSLYLGAGLIIVAIAVLPTMQNRWLRMLRSLATWLGLAMMVMACPPFSWIVDAAFAAAFLL